MVAADSTLRMRGGLGGRVEEEGKKEEEEEEEGSGLSPGWGHTGSLSLE